MPPEAQSPDTSVVCYTHLPGVQLAGPGPLPMLDGELVHLEFNAWTQLDDEFPFAKANYQEARPLFLVRECPHPGDTAELSIEELVEPALRSATYVYDAVLIATRTRPASPLLSMTYVVFPSSGAVSGWVGPFGREALIYGRAPVAVIDEELWDPIRDAAALLERVRTLTPVAEVEAGFAALERAARPEFTLLAGFVQEVIALEALLMPEVREGLTRTFGRRMAVITAMPDQRLEDQGVLARRIYAARSEGLHGGAPDDSEVDWGLLTAAHDALLLALLRSVEYLNAQEDLDPEELLPRLRSELDRAWEHPEARKRLYSSWPRSSPRAS